MANSNLVTREDLKNVFEALGEGSYGTRIDEIESLLETEELTLAVPYIDEFHLTRWGRIVTVSIFNPISLPTGSTNLTTLPVGWRPKSNVVVNAFKPDSSTPRNFRYNVRTDGSITVYNYGWSYTGNSNISTTFTYVAQ